MTSSTIDLPGTDREEARLAALYRYAILDTEAERDFDELAAVASHICGTPIAVLNLIDRDRQWGKAIVGLDDTEAPRRDSFCAHTIRGSGVMEVPDTLEDERFAQNPMVTGDPGLRFYAGAPLVTRDGEAIGAMCVCDRRPRRLEEQQIEALESLARQAMNTIELRLMLTREREQVERLEELDRLKNRFVSVVSHELRTPLTSVKGFLECVLEDADVLDPQHLRFLSTASRNAERLHRLVEDLLDTMRAKEGGLRIDRAPTDLAELVREAAAAIAPQAETAGVRVLVRCPDELPLVADAGRLGQLIDNLLSNAVKYSPGGGDVELRLAVQGEDAVLRVADHGIGIAPEEHDKLFESFFRASSATEHGIPGTGLGLAISQRIARAHGGELEHVAARPRGSEFVLTLPLSA